MTIPIRPISNLPALARLIWILCAGLALFFMTAAIGSRYQQLAFASPDANVITGQLRPEDVQALTELGISVHFYAAYFAALEWISGVLPFAIGVLIFWKRSGQWFTWLLSLGLITFGLISSPLTTPLEGLLPGLYPVLLALRTVGMGSFFLSLLMFPDGKFVPPRVIWLARAWIIYLVISLLVPDLRFKSSILWQSGSDFVVLLIVGAVILSVIAVQIHRFRSYAAPIQRQQSKWVVFGLAISFSLMVAAALPLMLVPFLNLTAAAVMLVRIAAFTVILLNAILFAGAFAAAILYARLWDIDIIIRRTVSYGLLTGLLALVYFTGVVLLQTVFDALTGRTDSPLITVLSTLILAGLFNPLRTRIQKFIDRRFYRSRFNSEQTLAHFAAAARDEVDIELLTVALLGVVDETMQPDRISLWLS